MQPRPLARIIIGCFLALLLIACATPMPSPEAKAQLAPGGKLLAAINLGNPVLANKDPASGEVRGVSVDLARELGRRLGANVELVVFTGAGMVVEALRDRKVDVGFVAVDPVRGAEMLQSHPYVVIEGAYLVRNESSIRANAEVDRAGNRVLVAQGSAYDLFLTREIKAATLMRTQGSPNVVNDFLAQKLEVAAGVKQQLQSDAQCVGGVRLLDGRFMVINQAMGTQKGRDAGLAYLNSFIEEMKASGFVAQALARNGVEGAAVAPPAAK